MIVSAIKACTVSLEESDYSQTPLQLPPNRPQLPIKLPTNIYQDPLKSTAKRHLFPPHF